MLSAVHSDRSGRIVMADYGAAMFDGSAVRPLEHAVPLPSDAELVTVNGREAIGIDRAGRPHPLGRSRFAVAALAPAGHVRTAFPMWSDDEHAPPLAPRAYTAVAGDASGALFAAAAPIDPEDGGRDSSADAALADSVGAALREGPANRLVRQLARCARDYRCRAAANTFLGRADGALPVAVSANEHPPEAISLANEREAHDAEPATFHPSPGEIADIAVRHFDRGGTLAAFGLACEGEPLLQARTLAAAIETVRARTTKGTLHLETNGSQPAALRRLVDAGLDSVAIRIASARADTYDRLHGPEGYRFADVRASLTIAAAAGVAVALVVLVLPGLTDRGDELDGIVALTASLPAGAQLVLRDLAADPPRALRLVPPGGGEPIGVARALERLRADASHVRIATSTRPLARV